MRYNFCTMFDKNYMAKGLTLYHSLLKQAFPFHLWVLCLDQESYEFIKKMNFDYITPIPLQELEDESLLSIKSTRSTEEYFWTLTPSLPLYILKKNQSLDNIAYLDADMYFYSSPDPLYKELGADSIYIIPHRFSPQHKEREKTDGIFNVGMIIFKNDPEGLTCLNWWRERCIEWCYREPENGKMGDQKYLDSFPKLFSKVKISENIGACVAPWNVKNYKVTLRNGIPYVNDAPVVFYHFFRLNIYKPALFLPLAPQSHYTDWSPAFEHIYKRHLRDLKNTVATLPEIFAASTINRPSIGIQTYESIRALARSIRRKIKYKYTGKL